jgi:hypothetical protein
VESKPEEASHQPPPEQETDNPTLLAGWLTRARVAFEVGVSVDTLARWETRRIGPPCVRIGRKVLYRAEAFRDWLISRERPVPSRASRAVSDERATTRRAAT